MDQVARMDILGCPVDSVSFDDTVEAMRRAVVSDQRLHIAVINVDMAMKARRDPAFEADLWASDLAIADGVPIVWSAALLDSPIRGRVSGTELVWSCGRISAETGCSVALIGAAPGVADRAAQALRKRYPGAVIHALPTPFPLEPDDSVKLAGEIKKRGAKIVLAALGAPRQERWIRSYLADCGANVGIGIGSAFDIICGDQRRAPRWMRDYGFEWFHRMMLDPRRLGRRYLIEDSPFIWAVLHTAILQNLKTKLTWK
ncbi:MAG: WecB/TagA/CpsF family glycosyltransferase [Rhodothermales bacterium]